MTDFRGRNLENARVRLRFAPGPWRWREASPAAPGIYELRVGRSELPPQYNATTARYEHGGPVRVFIQARKGDVEGEITLDLQ